jgi:hypothetical protein
MHMLLEVDLECAETGKERGVCGASPCGQLKAMSETMKLGNSAVGRFVFLHHHEDRLRNRTEAYLLGGTTIARAL